MSAVHKLTYWNVPGRAWVIRTCFKIGGIPFEDHFVADKAQLEGMRGPEGYNEHVPLGQIPVLELPNGKIVCESVPIARYAAKLAKLYPSDPVEALLVDEVIEVITECISKLPSHADEDTKKKLRQEYVEKEIPKYFGHLIRRIESSGSQFCVGHSLSLADLALYKAIKGFRAGAYDHISPSLDSAYPAIGHFITQLEADHVFAPYKY